MSKLKKEIKSAKRNAEKEVRFEHEMNQHIKEMRKIMKRYGMLKYHMAKMTKGNKILSVEVSIDDKEE